uniref:Uncharacterized protein n=1 Tax=viral metagenome TaxID=1070528 RepID=A0A6M3JMZ9_9ZZZZ
MYIYIAYIIAAYIGIGFGIWIFALVDPNIINVNTIKGFFEIVFMWGFVLIGLWRF